MPYRSLKPADGITDLGLRGKLTLNEHEIFDGLFGTPWAIDSFKIIIDARTGELDISKIKFENIVCQRGVFQELLDSIGGLRFPPQGL